MTDLFHEVQEDLRRDRLKAFWTRYGTILVVAAALVVAAVAGWRGYLYLQARAAADAGDRYQAASLLAASGKSEEARAAFEAIAKDSAAGYPALARLRIADETAKTDKAAALGLYRAIADDGAADALLRDSARIRGAYLAVDVGSREDVRALAGSLAAGKGSWVPLAREALGLAAYKAGDPADARRNFEAIAADSDAPGSIRQRADLMLAVLPPAAAPKPADPEMPADTAIPADPAKPTN